MLKQTYPFYPRFLLSVLDHLLCKNRLQVRVWEGGIDDAKDCSVSWDDCSTGDAFTGWSSLAFEGGVGGRAEEVKEGVRRWFDGNWSAWDLCCDKRSAVELWTCSQSRVPSLNSFFYLLGF